MNKAQERTRKNEEKGSPKIESAYSIEGHMVVTIKEGNFLGNISNLYLNVKDRKVMAIEFKKILWSDKYYVLTKDIASIGEDIIFINDRRSAKRINNINPNTHRSLHHLRGTQITTIKGKHLGELQDIEINSETLEVTGLCLNLNRKLPVTASEITIGEDEILVPPEYEFSITEIEDNIEKRRMHLGKDLINSISKNFHLRHPKEAKSKQQTRLN